MLVVAKGHQPQFVSKVDPFTGPIEAVLKPVNQASLGPKNQLRGRVVGPDNQPLVGAVVNFESYTSGQGGYGGQVEGFDPLAVTDDTGAFRLTGDTPFDSMDVTVEARGFAKKHFTQLASGTKRHQLAVNIGGSVTGRVLLDGKPLKGVAMGMVSVSRSMGEFTGDFEFGTREDGGFQFVNLPPNTDYFLYGKAASLKEHGAISTRRIRVNGDGSTTDAGELAVKSGLRLAGRVVLSDGSEIPQHTRVTVGWRDAWDVVFTDLDDAGRFEFRNLPPGSLSVSTRLAGYRFSAKNASLETLNPYSLRGRLDADKTDLAVLLELGPDLKANVSAFAGAPDDQAENLPLRGSEATQDTATR